MALPTAQTPGYTTYSGKVSCVCLAAWLPWLERLSLAHGYIRYNLDVLQLTGNYALSGGTHYGGGVFDIKQYDTRIAMLSREMGAPATWLRNMLYADGSPGNTHTHGVLSGCPHLSSGARWQISEQKAGRDGFANPHPDPLPDPKVYRTWSQGITWAKSEIVRITGQNIIDNLETVMALSDADKAWLSAQFAKLPWTYKNAGLTDRDAYDYLLGIPTDVWSRKIKRDGVEVDALQELANIGTQGRATAVAVADLTKAVATLAALVQQSQPVEPDPKPEPDPAPKPLPWVGVDVSGYQTLDVVKAHAASDDFVIVKATEGKGARLTSFTDRIAAVRGSTAKAGTYHYAWPENGWEADFANYVGYAVPRVGEVSVLDFEPWPKKQPLAKPETFPTYIVGWADAHLAKFGVDPLLYMPDFFVPQVKQYATAAQWDRIARIPFFKPGKGGLYVSDPAVGYGDTFGFQTLAMWQWTDSPLDQDLLYVPWSSIANTKA